MSIRQGLLALLARRSMYGYELRNEFEQQTGTTWPLNVGQVYTTLGRLERDGMVEPAGQDGESHYYYRITAAGREELDEWFAHPVSRTNRPRDELPIKLAMAVAMPTVDVRQVVQEQRTHTMRVLQDYTRLKARTSEEDSLAWSLVLDSLIFQTEAEVRWLDHCEARVTRAARERSDTTTESPSREVTTAHNDKRSEVSG